MPARALILTIVMSAMVAACGSTQFVRKVYSPQKGGTINYRGELGEDEAKDEIREFCGGGYVVLEEGDRGGLRTNSITFRCGGRSDWSK